MIGCRAAGPFDIWDTGVARNLVRISRCGDVFLTTVEICETSRSRGEDVFLVNAMMNQITDTKEATSNRASNGRGYELRGVVSSANQAGQFNCSSLTYDLSVLPGQKNTQYG